MPHKLKNLKIDRVDLVDKGANQEAHVLLFKRETEEPPTPESNPEIEVSNMPEDLQKQLEALQAEVAELTKRAETAEAEIAKRDSEPEEVDVDIWKGVHPEIRKKFEAQEQEIAIAKAAAQAEHDSRVRQECIQKAARYEYLPMNPDDDWEVLKAIDTLDEKVSKRVYELFNAGNTNLGESGITKERGSNSSDEGGRTEYDEIQRLVNDRLAKSESGLTYDSALSAIFRERPDLYRAYTKSVQTGKGN